MPLKAEKQQKVELKERPPVVVVMGHIDHGKSKLLDYIRRTNVVESEAGSITQYISAYEVVHKNEAGLDRKITFLDTPGHEAFSEMRERGALAADIAVLVVSAEEGVKSQTREALKAIKEAKIPYLAAINKIDKPGADLEQTMSSLAENEIYLEGRGGNIPYVAISAKTGQGVNELLNLILLMAELEELKGNPAKRAEGFVVESGLDPKRGISASLIIKDGTLKKGMFVTAGNVLSNTGIFENFLGAEIETATFSSPVKITGFNTPVKFPGSPKIPLPGEKFYSFDTKKEAEEAARKSSPPANQRQAEKIKEERKEIPVTIRADVFGSAEAIEKEIIKLDGGKTKFRIVKKGVGNINESDVSLAAGNKDALIIGFNVKIDPPAQNLAKQLGIAVKNFEIIYKIKEWLQEKLERKTEEQKSDKVAGRAEVLKIFSRSKNKTLVGGKVLEGSLAVGKKIGVWRGEEKISEAKLIDLEANKNKVKEVKTGLEFGALLETKEKIEIGDFLED